MKLEVPFKEIQVFLFNLYHITIGFKNIGIDRIKITYFISFILTIKDVTADAIVFQYKSNTVVNLGIKCIHFFMRKKLKKFPFVWNSKTREVIIDLKKIQALDEFLKHSSISDLSFIDETILLEVALNSEK